MSRCTNDTYSKYAITSADKIKNVPVDLTNLIDGYSLVYDNNKFVLKDVQGGGGSGSDITIADVKEVTDNIKEGTNITITREDTGAITINSTVSGTGGITKQEVLDSIIAGDNVTINRDTQGQITVSATGATGGGSIDGIYVVRSEKFKLTQGSFTKPYEFQQTGGGTYVTLSAPNVAGSESVINYYSNDDIEVYGVLQASFKDLSSYAGNSISDAFRVGIGLPLLQSIQVTKKYPRSLAGINVNGYCVAGVTPNTFTVSGTSSSAGNYAYVNFSYNLEGGNALIKTYSNTNKLVYFRAYLKAEDITLRSFEITEPESHMLDYYYDEKEKKWVKDELWQQRLEMNYIKD